MSAWNISEAVWSSLTAIQRNAIDGRASWDDLNPDERYRIVELAREALSHDRDNSTMVVHGPGLLEELRERVMLGREAITEAADKKAELAEIKKQIEDLTALTKEKQSWVQAQASSDPTSTGTNGELSPELKQARLSMTRSRLKKPRKNSPE